MFKHLWVERGMLSGRTEILADGILQDTFAGEKLQKASAGGEVETTGGYFYRPGRKFFLFRISN